MLRAKIIKGCGQKKILHLLCCFLSSRGRKDKLLNQLPIMCRKKILVTSEHNTCSVQRAAYCDTGSTAETLTDHFGYPEKLMTLCGYDVPCGRNLNFSVSRSYTLSGEAGELMLSALMSSQFLEISSSLCTQTILHPA